jgi:hypothetical protein
MAKRRRAPGGSREGECEGRSRGRGGEGGGGVPADDLGELVGVRAPIEVVARAAANKQNSKALRARAWFRCRCGGGCAQTDGRSRVCGSERDAAGAPAARPQSAQGGAQSRRRCGHWGSPVPAQVAGMSPVPEQMWVGASPVPGVPRVYVAAGIPALMRCGWVEPNPGADVAGVSPNSGADVAAINPGSPLRACSRRLHKVRRDALERDFVHKLHTAKGDTLSRAVCDQAAHAV